MFLEFLAMAATGVAASSMQNSRFGEVDGWTVTSANGGCSMGRYYPGDKLDFSITQTKSGQLQFTFINDRWRFADADRRDYGFAIKSPSGEPTWDGLWGSEWTSSGAGFVRIGIASNNADAMRQDLAEGGRFVARRGGKRLFSVDLPRTSGAFAVLANCVAHAS